MTLDEATLNEARELRSRLLELQHDADRAKLDYHHAIRRLHAAGGSMREIAEELDLSHQRVHQIVEGDEPIDARIGWQAGRRHRRFGLRRFTRVARQVVMRAQKEAHALGAEEIAPEHLLIGLAAVERGTAARALAAQNVDLERLRTEVGGEAVREPSRGRRPACRGASAPRSRARRRPRRDRSDSQRSGVALAGAARAARAAIASAEPPASWNARSVPPTWISQPISGPPTGARPWNANR